MWPLAPRAEHSAVDMNWCSEQAPKDPASYKLMSEGSVGFDKLGLEVTVSHFLPDPRLASASPLRVTCCSGLLQVQNLRPHADIPSPRGTRAQRRGLLPLQPCLACFYPPSLTLPPEASLVSEMSLWGHFM